METPPTREAAPSDTLTRTNERLKQKLKAAQRSASLGLQWKKKHNDLLRKYQALLRQNEDMRSSILRWRGKFNEELENRQELVGELFRLEDKLSSVLGRSARKGVGSNSNYNHINNRKEKDVYGTSTGCAWGNDNHGQGEVEGDALEDERHDASEESEPVVEFSFWGRRFNDAEKQRHVATRYSKAEGECSTFDGSPRSDSEAEPSRRYEEGGDARGALRLISPLSRASSFVQRSAKVEGDGFGVGLGMSSCSSCSSTNDVVDDDNGDYGDDGDEDGYDDDDGYDRDHDENVMHYANNNIGTRTEEWRDEGNTGRGRGKGPDSDREESCRCDDTPSSPWGTPKSGARAKNCKSSSTFDHFLVVGADVENKGNKPHILNSIIDEITGNIKQKTSGFFGLGGRRTSNNLPPVTVKPTVLLHYAANDGFKDLPSSEDSIASFCFPRGISVKEINVKESMSDVNAIFYGPHCHRGDGSFIFTFNDDTGLVDGQTNGSTLYGVCVTQPRLIRTLEVPRVYCILTRIPHFDLHFRVLWDVIAAQRIGRLPVEGCAPGFDRHGYDTLDFIKQTFIRYSKVNIDGDIGEFVSFQVCSHLPPITFRPVPVINRLLKDCKASARESIMFNSLGSSISSNQIRESFRSPWNKLRKESISATKEWSLPPLFSVVPAGILCDVIGELLKETQLVVTSERLSMLSSTVLGLVYLLKPQLWVAPIIPLLPQKMEDFMQAPVPYIIGYPGKALPNKNELQDGVGILNLDAEGGVAFEVTKNGSGREVDLALGIQRDGENEEGDRCRLPGKRRLLKLLRKDYSKLNDHEGGKTKKVKPPIYEPSAAQQECADRITSVIRRHISKISAAGLEVARGEGVGDDIFDVILGDITEEDCIASNENENASSASQAAEVDSGAQRSSDEKHAIEARIRTSEVCNTTKFFARHTRTQMFANFAEEQNRSERQRSSNPAADSDLASSAKKNPPVADQGSSSTSKVKITSKADELYASPQKVVVRVHALSDADPRKLDVAGYLK